MKILTPSRNAHGLRVAVVVSRFNHLISVRLLDGAREAMLSQGIDDGDLALYWVPGAFEIPLAASRLAQSGQFDAIVTLGSVIRRRHTAFRLCLPWSHGWCSRCDA